MSQPRQLDSPLYRLIHSENIAAFNSQKPPVGELDLRALDAQGINFTNAYFRGADLRGLDLRDTQLEGASLAHAQISGAYFPAELSADEILMSLNLGPRLRYRTRAP